MGQRGDTPLTPFHNGRSSSCDYERVTANGRHDSTDWWTQLLRLRVPWWRIIAVTVLVIVTIVFCLILAPSQPGGALIAGGTAILGAMAGLLLQPVPRERDHSTLAAASIEGILEMSERMGDASTVLSGIASSMPESVEKVRLVILEADLNRLDLKLRGSLAAWDEVSSEAFDKVQANRAKGLEMLKRMAGE